MGTLLMSQLDPSSQTLLLEGDLIWLTLSGMNLLAGVLVTFLFYAAWIWLASQAGDDSDIEDSGRLLSLPLVMMYGTASFAHEIFLSNAEGVQHWGNLLISGIAILVSVVAMLSMRNQRLDFRRH